MGKKHKKQLRELQRLQALHQDAASGSDEPLARREKSGGDFKVETQSPIVDVTQSNSSEASIQVAVHEHNHVKRDLVFLVVLIVVMIAGLIALNWAIDNTEVGSWLLSMFGA